MENVENLILEHLRVIRTDVGAVKEDAREIKQRLANLESVVGGIKRDLGGHVHRERDATHSI